MPHNYDPNAVTRKGKPNPFSYYTKYVMRAFNNRIDKERRHIYYKLKSFQNVGGFAAVSDDVIGNDSVIMQNVLNEVGIGTDYMEWISVYEASMAERKQKEKDRPWHQIHRIDHGTRYIG